MENPDKRPVLKRIRGFDILAATPIPAARLTAPGEVVLAWNGSMYVAWFHNKQDGGLYHGDYRNTLSDAETAYMAKCRRYGAVGAT